MRFGIAPHPFPYQGSKRKLAPVIVEAMPGRVPRLVEPFAGSAAVSIYTALCEKAASFLLNDTNGPLMDLWRKILDDPHGLADAYEGLWMHQKSQERQFFDEVRASFNREHDPAHLLYLLARCVKAAVRYNTGGEFNNSPDNRRKGMSPSLMRDNIVRVSKLLRAKTELASLAYGDLLSRIRPDDVLYMDPPYQGVCAKRNPRYSHGVYFNEFVEFLEALNARRISYLVSYDGSTGDRRHGRFLPDSLDLVRLDLNAGRSSQATLLGRKHDTVESLYLSRLLVKKVARIPTPRPPKKVSQEARLFDFVTA